MFPPNLNSTTLLRWNYSSFSNGTLSNASRCYLVSDQYTINMVVVENGSFYNSTSCYSPILPIRTRSKIGLLFAAFFSISIVFTLHNLRKHGQLFLPVEKRFLPIGRRWQWYWMLIVAVFGIISSVTNIDVDRYYLPELPVALSSAFWSLMLPATVCIIWESIRNWGSFQERQRLDDYAFAMVQDDLRDRTVLCTPLLFYAFIVVVSHPSLPSGLQSTNNSSTFYLFYRAAGVPLSCRGVRSSRDYEQNLQQQIRVSGQRLSSSLAHGLRFSFLYGIPPSISHSIVQASSPTWFRRNFCSF